MGIFDNIFDSSADSLPVTDFLVCVACALVCGLIVAGFYSVACRSSRGYVLSLGIMPAIVATVILVVNGSIGVGVAVAGAFSLIRFRSAPGNAREIGVLFLAMACGLLAGAGYLAYAILFALIVSALHLAYTRMNIMSGPSGTPKVLRFTVPQGVDYATAFEDVFDEYTISRSLRAVRTTDLGTLFKLTYDVVLCDEGDVAAFADRIRERNGNMEVNIFNAEQSDWTL